VQWLVTVFDSWPLGFLGHVLALLDHFDAVTLRGHARDVAGLEVALRGPRFLYLGLGRHGAGVAHLGIHSAETSLLLDFYSQVYNHV
jgi:hypothetical protein